MQLFLDVNAHQVIQSPGSRSPGGPYPIKMHDTVGLDIYLVRGGGVLDYGAGTAIHFALNLAQPAAISILVDDTTFTYLTDAGGNPYYHGVPNFDTTLLLAALGTSYSIQCAGEIRFQTPAGEIVRTLDIPFVIYRSIVSEVTFDTLAADFTVPAIAASVTVQIGATGWLYNGKLLTIATAGQYTVASIIDATHFSATNTGASGNTVATTVIAHPQTVSSTPPSVPATYPDVSTIELLVRKGVANGYAPLDSGGKLASGFLPSGILTGVELSANRDVAGGYPSLDSQSLLDADQVPVDGTSLVVTSATIIRAGTTTSGSAIVTGLSATSDLTLGAPVTGSAGISGGTTLLSIDSGTQIHLSANATLSGSPLLTFTTQKISTGSSVDYADPANGVELRDDFLSGGYGALPWNASNLASAGVGYNGASAFQARGAAIYSLDATVPAYALFSIGNQGVGNEYCLPVAAGPLTLKSKLGVDILSDGTNTYTCYFGFMRMQRTTFGTSPSPWAGLYFEYDQSVSPNWQACVATGTNKATGTTRADTGVAVVANTWINAKIVVNSAWGNFEFFINNVLKATITSGHLPTTADLGLSPVYFHNRTASGGAGNLRNFFARGFYLLYQFNTET
jgi:hypothetical protein